MNSSSRIFLFLIKNSFYKTVCIDCLSVAFIKHCDQDSLQKNIYLSLWSRKLETIMVEMTYQYVARNGGWSRKWRFHILKSKHEAERESTGSRGRLLNIRTLPQCPQKSHIFQTTQNKFTTWEPSIQRPEPMGVFLIQPTALSFTFPFLI